MGSKTSIKNNLEPEKNKYIKNEKIKNLFKLYKYNYNYDNIKNEIKYSIHNILDTLKINKKYELNIYDDTFNFEFNKELKEKKIFI